MLLALTVFVQAQGTTISIDEIRPGMRGYGLTVFRGTQPERFDVEVIDVLHMLCCDEPSSFIISKVQITSDSSVSAGERTL